MLLLRLPSAVFTAFRLSAASQSLASQPGWAEESEGVDFWRASMAKAGGSYP